LRLCLLTLANKVIFTGLNAVFFTQRRFLLKIDPFALFSFNDVMETYNTRIRHQMKRLAVKFSSCVIVLPNPNICLKQGLMKFDL
jgi:hypothetical protein